MPKQSKHLVKTRTSSTCPIFGSAKDISAEVYKLPTYEDVMRCCIDVRLALKGSGSKQPPAAIVAKSTDENFELSYYDKNKELPEPNIQNPKKIQLQNTARVADLTGSSNRTVAKLVNAVFEDLNVISAENPSKVVDKNKIRRITYK